MHIKLWKQIWWIKTQKIIKVLSCTDQIVVIEAWRHVSKKANLTTQVFKPDDGSTEILGKDEDEIHSKITLDENQSLRLKHVPHVPSYKINLSSVSNLSQNRQAARHEEANFYCLQK